MSVSFTCGCGRRVRASAARGGRRGKCPACGQAVLVPNVWSAAASGREAEQEAFLWAMKELNRRPAAHAAASCWIGVAVLAAWAMLLGVGWALVVPAGDLVLAHESGRSVALPVLLLWAAGAIGLVKGSLGLMQPRGQKTLAVVGSLLNGLACVGPLVALLVWTA